MRAQALQGEVCARWGVYVCKYVNRAMPTREEEQEQKNTENNNKKKKKKKKKRNRKRKRKKKKKHKKDAIHAKRGSNQSQTMQSGRALSGTDLSAYRSVLR